MAAAMDPSWEDEDEEEEEEIEEAVSVGRRPSAVAVIAVPSPVGEKSPGCGRREGGPETARSLSDPGTREAGSSNPSSSLPILERIEMVLGVPRVICFNQRLHPVFTKVASLNWDLGHFCLLSLARWPCTILTFLSSARSNLFW